MMVMLKLNGRARISMDLSPPHQTCSCNERMANYEEFKPVTMASDVKWMGYLHWRVGQLR